MARGTRRALLQLAKLHGIDPGYEDVTGSMRRASEETLVAALRAMGEPVESARDAETALAASRAARRQAWLPPVAVAWDSRALRVPLGDAAPEDLRASLHLEDGSEWEAAVATDSRGSCVRVPRGLPFGYQRLRVTGGNDTRECTVLSAPRRAAAAFREGERSFGVFLPLHALHGERSLGVGDFSDLRNLAEWTAERGGGVVGTLPLLAAFLDEPYSASPYSPASRLFWNELYVDPRAVPELADCQAARAVLESPDFRSEVEALRALPEVDYRRAAALRRRVLEPLSRSFFERAPEARRDAFEAFCARKPRLRDYAAFRAVTERQRRSWHAWPQDLRDRLREAEPGRDYDEAAARHHLYAQWVADEQVAAAGEPLRRGGGAGLYLDLPLGVSPDSYDMWRERELFVGGASAGAPPDTFFVHGQDWGFHPLHPERLREQGYRHLAQALGHHLVHAGLLRIDHVMQFHRLWWVPRGLDAGRGVYVRYPAEELYAVLSIESHRVGAGIVGENLGTVPPSVNEAMRRHGLLGMYVLQYELDPWAQDRRPFREVPDDALAALNTHDMPTFRAFWEGADVEERLRLGLLDAPGAEAEHAARERMRHAIVRDRPGRRDAQRDELHPAALEAALAGLSGSAAPLVLVGLEDVWGERVSQNVPGTRDDERPNWRRRARLSIEELSRDPQVREVLERVRQARRNPPAAEPERQRAPQRPVARRMTDVDAHLLNEGRHFELHEKLGAHARSADEGGGHVFAVWAPNAERVSVIGDWNGWDPGRDPLAPQGPSGVWEGAVARTEPGQRYKFHVVSRYGGYRADKADPFAARTEVPPATASVLWHREHEWSDAEWMRERGRRIALDAPVSIYEVHLGSWRRKVEEGGRSLTYRELAGPLVEYVRSAGFTHVELLPVMEHPFYGSWGYQTTGYFAPTSRQGTPQDFMELVDRLHQAGIGVLLDWVPSHFPSDEHGLAYFDGTHLFEHADPRLGYHPDWNSYVFNYARHEVRSFLISSALHWLGRYHVDGIRVDAVASMLYRDYSRRPGEWIPNARGGRENDEAIHFLRQLNAEIYRVFPDVHTFAEESTAWPLVSRPIEVSGLGFGLKWDMGWMHDTLQYLARDPIHRRHHHGELTFRSVYQHSENFCLPLSHDEVVHGKGSLLTRMPGDEWQQRANLRLLLGYQWTQPGKKLLFMGGEFGQRREWNHDDSLDWHLLEDPRHAGLLRLVSDLNRLYRSERALHELDCDPAGFEWIDARDADQSVLVYLRRGRSPEEVVLVALNFTPVPRHNYRVGAPCGGHFRELLNTDAREYGGSGQGNLGGVEASPTPQHGRFHSLNLTLPPLAMVVLRPEGGGR